MRRYPLILSLFWLIGCDSSATRPTLPIGEPQDAMALTGNPSEQRQGAVNGVLLQSFHWHTSGDGRFWKQLAEDAPTLARKGFTALWLPPAYKGAGGKSDVGYGTYDLYDLGEFDQKGSQRTKYGTRAEYLAAIDAAHSAGLDVFPDIVLNHRLGADRTETAPAFAVDPNDRRKDIPPAFSIQAWTVFDFPGRGDAYSSFRWNWTHFSGVDWDQQRQEKGRVYRFNAPGKAWASDVSAEFGNYDYLMGADVDYGNPGVVEEMQSWGDWYRQTTGLDGFRLDAVKHLKKSFVRAWIERQRAASGRELFAVAEYWDPSVKNLLAYLQDQPLSLFDVPLHMNLYKAGQGNGSFNMAALLAGTLMEQAPQRAVSFVDNHDTQAGQALQSPVADWFKPLAYALILLRAEGYPTVFALDYQGPLQATLDQLLRARRDLAYGEQLSYFDDRDLIGWTRRGDARHKAALAVVLSDSAAGSKRMEVGTEFAGRCFQNPVHPDRPCVPIGADGFGDFPVDARSFALWTSERP